MGYPAGDAPASKLVRIEPVLYMKIRAAAKPYESFGSTLIRLLTPVLETLEKKPSKGKR